ncbi:MAG: hypothetical protein ACK5II_12055, partial [Paracoccus sp. (in: a-proteobacteria)]
SFFVRQAKIPQEPPDRTAMHRRSRRRCELGRQFRRRQVALLPDPARDPILVSGQLAVPAAVALLLRKKAPVVFASLTMSLTNLTDTLKRAAADRCVLPSDT